MTARVDLATQLKSVPMFSSCTNAELVELAGLATTQTVEAATEVVHEGSTDASRFFVIAAGHARVTKRLRKVAELGPGDFFGELALLVDRPRNCSVTAVTDLELVVLERRTFRDALERIPTLATRIAAALADRLYLLADDVL